MVNGGRYPGLSEEKRSQLIEFEEIIFQAQLRVEESFLSLAQHYLKQGEKVIMFFDRGFMDIKAYVPSDVWQQLLTKFNVSEA